MRFNCHLMKTRGERSCFSFDKAINHLLVYYKSIDCCQILTQHVFSLLCLCFSETCFSLKTCRSTAWPSQTKTCSVHQGLDVWTSTPAFLRPDWLVVVRCIRNKWEAPVGMCAVRQYHQSKVNKKGNLAAFGPMPHAGEVTLFNMADFIRESFLILSFVFLSSLFSLLH